MIFVPSLFASPISVFLCILVSASTKHAVVHPLSAPARPRTICSISLPSKHCLLPVPCCLCQAHPSSFRAWSNIQARWFSKIKPSSLQALKLFSSKSRSCSGIRAVTLQVTSKSSYTPKSKTGKPPCMSCQQVSSVLVSRLLFCQLRIRLHAEEEEEHCFRNRFAYRCVVDS
jgi:hypothetical protein